MIKFRDEVEIIPEQTYFQIEKEEIVQLFEPDNI